MPWRTVRRNVELLTELHDIPKDERRRLGQYAIDLVGLNGFEDHYPKSLSGGMRMRCSLARTLTLRPPIMMFDEPFGAVDEITREHLNEETLRLFEQEGFAGLFITHSIPEAVFMSTPGARDVGPPRADRRRLRGAVPVSARSRAALRPRVRRAQRRGVPRPAGERSERDAIAPSPSRRPPVGRREPGRRSIESPTVRVEPREVTGQARAPSVVVPPLVLVVVLIGVWYFISYRVVKRRFLLHPPHDVIQEGFLKWDNLHEILDGLLYDHARSPAIGLAIAFVARASGSPS